MKQMEQFQAGKQRNLLFSSANVK